jgi:conjugal transfer mating pair stabilization protein TraN
MKLSAGSIIALCCVVLSFSSMANDDYNAGSNYASGIKGQGTSAISNMDPAVNIPGFTSNPQSSSRYGGVTDTSNNMDADGNKALRESKEGKTIMDSILNNPKEPISTDAPFIARGFDAQANAGSVTDGTFEGCRATQVTKTVFTNHVCERDVNVSKTCKRIAYVTTTGSTESYRTQLVMNAGSVTGTRIAGYWIKYDFVVPENGVISSGTWAFLYPSDPSYRGSRLNYSLQTFGQIVTVNVNQSGSFGIVAQAVTKGQVVSLLVRYNTDGHYDQGADGLKNGLANGKFVARITLTLDAVRNTLKPVVNFSAPCALSQEFDVSLTDSVCTAAGGNRDVVVDGITYSVYSNCWEYTDTYRTQSAGVGTCGDYASNTACTVATRQCAFTDNSICLHENVTYSCETQVTGEGMMCGGEFFCTDGTCAAANEGKSDSFQKAVSQLAAVAAAGKDVAAMNDVNVSAFTGRGQSCRKAVAGFNDCCKAGGWGNDVGLAHCSSEEKALGQARERLLTVEVGEYCDKRVLGVCLQKKRSYCVFDSKLAQIVQQQGRQWQLGINFGSAESPNCSGINVAQLQALNFAIMDFKNFYADLENGSAIPGGDALSERIKEQVAAQMQQAGGGK